MAIGTATHILDSDKVLSPSPQMRRPPKSHCSLFEPKCSDRVTIAPDYPVWFLPNYERSGQALDIAEW
jgi:hypothetical protein